MSLHLKIKKTIPKMVVHCIKDDEIWTSSNYTLYQSKDEGTTFNKMSDLPVLFIIPILTRLPLFTRVFRRFGIRTIMQLKSGTILIVANRKLLRFTQHKYEVVYRFSRGFGPMREGWCEDDEDNCFIGEYFLNERRNTHVDLLKSTNDGQSWKTVYSFNNIRHIHFVQYDPYNQKIWLGTGDTDDESAIWLSHTKGETWTKIVSGDQRFRAVSLLFTQDHVYWGSDAPTRQNYIYRYHRSSGEIEQLAAVNGPVYYSTILKNGIKIFTTTAEGNSEGKSVTWDNKAHIWASEDGVCWEDLIHWEKDLYPHIFGYGSVLLPHGQPSDTLFFTPQCLRKVDNILHSVEFVREIKSEELAK